MIAAAVWLMIFVPGYASRSQLREATSIAKSEEKVQRAAKALTVDDRIRRLVNTQRGFSLVFAFTLLGSVALATFAFGNAALWIPSAVVGLISVAALFIQRAAGSQAASLATQKHKAKATVRSKISTTASRSREWTPNPLPAPINPATLGELVAPVAEVIEIRKPAAGLSSSDLDAILARRRAI